MKFGKFLVPIFILIFFVSFISANTYLDYITYSGLDAYIVTEVNAVYDIRSSYKNNVIWNITTSDACDVLVRPEAGRYTFFAGEIK